MTFSKQEEDEDGRVFWDGKFVGYKDPDAFRRLASREELARSHEMLSRKLQIYISAVVQAKKLLTEGSEAHTILKQALSDSEDVTAENFL